jgi:hypothetical protein
LIKIRTEDLKKTKGAEMREAQKNWNEFILWLVGENQIPKSLYQLLRKSFFCGFISTMTMIMKDIQEISEIEFNKKLQKLLQESNEFLREINLEMEKNKTSDNV